MSSIPEQIVQAGKLMFERRLTDIAGGNVSCRQGDRIFITPTGAGQKYLWDLRPEQILSAPIAGDTLLSDPLCSQESLSHLLGYRAFPEAQAIIHSHPFHIMPFCAAETPIPALLKATQLYADRFDFIPDAPMYSTEQAEAIVAGLEPHRDKLESLAAVVLMPRHGIFIAAGSLLQALDCLERMDTNAYCFLAQKWIGP